MDPVIAMFGDALIDGHARILGAGRELLSRSRPDLLARLRCSSPIEEPLLLARLMDPLSSGSTLDQLVIGSLPESVRPRTVPILTDLDGHAELPGIGVLETNRRMCALNLEVGERLVVQDGSRLESASLTPLPTAADGAITIDTHIAAPLQHLTGPRPPGAPARGHDEVDAGVRRALVLLRLALPDFAEVVSATTRRVVAFNNGQMNSFAAPSAHGAVFFNLAHGAGAVYHLEDLLHQSGHVAFQAMTLDPTSVLADPDRVLAGDTDDGHPRTMYVVLHACVTERWMARGLLAAIESGLLSRLEVVEARGRLAFILPRYVADLTDLIGAGQTTPTGDELLRHLLNDLRDVARRSQAHVLGLSLQGQPYNFHLGTFLRHNTKLRCRDA